MPVYFLLCCISLFLSVALSLCPVCPWLIRVASPETLQSSNPGSLVQLHVCCQLHDYFKISIIAFPYYECDLV